MVLIRKFVMNEKLVYLSRLQQMLDVLVPLEELLLTSAPTAVVDIAARHDTRLATSLLDLAEANARALDGIATVLSQPRDLETVRDIIATMRTGVTAVGSLLER